MCGVRYGMRGSVLFRYVFVGTWIGAWCAESGKVRLLAAAAGGVSNSSSLSSSNKSWNVFRRTGPGVVFVVLLVPFRFPILFVFLLYYWWYYYYWY